MLPWHQNESGLGLHQLLRNATLDSSKLHSKRKIAANAPPVGRCIAKPLRGRLRDIDRPRRHRSEPAIGSLFRTNRVGRRRFLRSKNQPVITSMGFRAQHKRSDGKNALLHSQRCSRECVAWSRLEQGGNSLPAGTASFARTATTSHWEKQETIKRMSTPTWTRHSSSEPFLCHATMATSTTV